MENSAIETATAAIARATFTVPLHPMKEAAAYLSRKIVQRRNTIPILSMLRIEAGPDGAVMLTAHNLDQQATLTLAGDVESPGAFCVDAGALMDALAKAGKGRADATVTICEDDGRAVLKMGRARFNLPTLPTDDFPRFTPTGETCVSERGPVPLPVKFSAPAVQLLADLKALEPCMGKDETRYYLGGVALQVRELGGQERLALIACDGGNIGVASRAVPEGAGGMADAIVPADAVKALIAAGKILAGVDALTVLQDAKSGRLTFRADAFELVTKSIDGTFPAWERAFEQNAPTGEADAPLFPDLLPGAPTGAMERLGKAAPGSIAWEFAGEAMLGTVETDDGLAYLSMRLAGEGCGRKGFEFAMTGREEAKAYLLQLAEAHGMPSAEALQARAAEINAAWEERDAMLPPFARADYCTNGQEQGRAEAFEPKLQMVRGKIVGLTVAGEQYRSTWYEDVTDWESLAERRERREGRAEPLEGSHSVLMPADGPQLQPENYVDGPDGHRYPVADNGSAIHLSKEQLRALIGESCFETVEFPGPDGKPRYVARWLYEAGDARLLIVGKNGRAPKREDDVREYVTRAEIEAALAGEPIPEPVAEYAEALEAAPEPVQAPETAPAATTPAPEPEIAPSGPEIAPEGQAEPASDPLADVLARLASLEASLATLSAESVEGATGETEPDKPEWQKQVDSLISPSPEAEIAQLREKLDWWQHAANVRAENARKAEARVAELERELRVANHREASRPKRSPAHERAVRRAWAERRARRMAQAGYDGERIRANEAVREARKFEQWWQTVSADVAVFCNERDAVAYQARRIARRARRMVAAERARAERINGKRRRNALFARQRTRELIAAVNHMHGKLDQAKMSPTYFNAETGLEQFDVMGQQAHFATVARERAERAENALAAMKARCERAEAARDTLADAVESMGTRLANAEAAVRRLSAAA